MGCGKTNILMAGCGMKNTLAATIFGQVHGMQDTSSCKIDGGMCDEKMKITC